MADTTHAKYLVVIVGPTAIGKTATSIEVAKALNANIISADSRQFFREMSIGTARVTNAEMDGVPHHFVGFLPVTAQYSAGMFEADALQTIAQLHESSQFVVMAGGSGLYVDAVCNGIDDIPRTDKATRTALQTELNENGLDALLKQLEEADPAYFNMVDRNNPRRVLRALEVIRMTGRPYTSFRKREPAKRPFKVIKIGLQMEREQLYERINLRVDLMMKAGLLEEARSLYKHRALTALQTVGYSELFDHFAGKITLEQAVELIKRNTRRYAKRQLTWLTRDDSIHWVAAGESAGQSIITFLKNKAR